MPDQTAFATAATSCVGRPAANRHAATMAVYVPIPSGKSLKVRGSGRTLFGAA